MGDQTAQEVRHKNTVAAVQAWLDGCTAEAALSEDEIKELITLIGDNRLKLLIKLMMGEREALLVALQQISLHSMEYAARASVIQGKIQGIERVRETLLELVTVEAESSINPAAAGK